MSSLVKFCVYDMHGGVFCIEIYLHVARIPTLVACFFVQVNIKKTVKTRSGDSATNENGNGSPQTTKGTSCSNHSQK